MDSSSVKYQSKGKKNRSTFGQTPVRQDNVRPEHNRKKMYKKFPTSSVPNEKIGSKKRSSAFTHAFDEFNRKKLEIQKAKEDTMKRKLESKQALQRYKEKKALKMKTLSIKTKKGQPVMKYRMENLLEIIQNRLK